ncbi:hypothetical protein [Fluviispira sanaruensis]|uniref:Uncharacterized protein n=1 Tax=Fluviispira sanaruensis TaxID=2493639 RepID=A0A4P2VMJ5_FLUSA|nr:hypothetical protein [Fluviispira sanaruensis]BBH54626.1 hypothetical protein JCM31447_31000 [Fluviispira sanaruensis]
MQNKNNILENKSIIRKYIKQRNKMHALSLLLVLLSSAHTANLYADELSYGTKFTLTTIAGCAVGFGSGYGYAQANNYDSQPSQILGWMGAATGCLTGALFSYLFYDDNTAKMASRISSDEKTITDLQIQLARLKNEKMNFGNENQADITPNFAMQNPFENLGVSEIITKKTLDEKNLPKGFSSETCSKWLNFYLIGDGGIETEKKEKLEFIAIDRNFALIGFQFAYSYDGCFKPSDAQNGSYYSRHWPELRDFLNGRVHGFKAKLMQAKALKEEHEKEQSALNNNQ